VPEEEEERGSSNLATVQYVYMYISYLNYSNAGVGRGKQQADFNLAVQYL